MRTTFDFRLARASVLLPRDAQHAMILARVEKKDPEAISFLGDKYWHHRQKIVYQIAGSVC